MAQNTRRWYDKNKILSEKIERLRRMHPEQEYQIVLGLLDLLRAEQPEALEKFVIPTDIESWNRRWYDDDPLFWLAINGLKNADKQVVDKVIRYLHDQFGES